MTNAWLQQQRKGALTEIADHVGLKNVERYKKIDLEVALEEHLRANSSKLSSDSKVAPFFYTVDPLSPVKQDPATGTVQEKKPRARRQTIKAREELKQEDASSPSTSTHQPKTPSRTLSLARTVPLPPSPSVIAEQIDATTTTILTTLSTTLSNSPLPHTLHRLRQTLSTVTGIELLTLLVESWGLRSEILPLRYLTTVPAFPALGTPDIPLKVPDFFALLTAAFWGPFALWLFTSVLAPLLGGWLVNLRGSVGGEGQGEGEESAGGGGFDAVSFNVVKGIAAWVVYARGGGPRESSRVVERGVPGGSMGMLVGAGVGVLAGLYEAVLRK